MMQLIDDHLPSPKSSLNTIRSLICDRNGIIIAETVYRCLFCAAIFDSLDSIQLHYHGDHYEETPPAHLPQPPHRSLMKNSNETIIIDYDNDDYDDNVVTSENDLTDSIHGHHMVEEDVETNNSNNNSDETLDLNLGFIPLPPSTPTLIKQQPSNNNQQQGGSGAKGGLVTCEVCGLTKFYSHISRRYGIFSCESCAKFFYRYSQKPVHYTCSHDGNCSLNSSGIRCKSCLLNACLKKYVLDPKKHSKVFKKHFLNNSSSAERSIIQKNNRSSSLLKKPNHSVALKFSANKSSYNRSKKILVCGNGGGVGDHDDDGGLKFSSNKCRRMACGSCQSCSADDCGSCLYCLDKPKFGGSDVKKQKCLKRRCLHLK